MRLVEHNRACDGFGFHFFLVQFIQTYESGGISPTAHFTSVAQIQQQLCGTELSKAALLTSYVIEDGEEANVGFHTFIKGTAEE